MKIALIRANKIVEFVDAPFPVHADLTFVDVADDTTLQDRFVDGSVVKATTTPQTVGEVRGIRNALLSSSDWTQMPDTALSDSKKAEWANYRQALRDLPANTADPSNPTWPEEPS
jgi:hypothetical protein